MDAAELFERLRPTLDEALERLEQLPDAGDDESIPVGFGMDRWAFMVAFWTPLRVVLTTREAGREALDDLRVDPADHGNRAALFRQVRKAIVADADLQRQLSDAVAAGLFPAPPGASTWPAAGAPGAKYQEAGPGGVNVAGNHRGDTTINNILISPEMRELVAGLLPRTLSESQRRETATGYLQFLEEKYRFLELKGMGLNNNLPLRMPLLELYVPLKARRTLPEGETWSEELRIAGRRLGDEEREALFGPADGKGARGGGGGLGEPEPILDLLAAQDGLVILGDPGSGKTTLLKFLALTLATGQGDRLGLAGYLPLLIPLAAYAEALAAGPCTLTEFIVRHLRGLTAGHHLELLLEPALAEGRVLFLLDGLDEVRDDGQRNRVVEEVKDFFIDRRRCGNRFVMTSRIVGYAQVRPCAADLGECTLVDFGDAEIEDFITRWTAAVERQASGAGRQATYDAADERAGLLRAVRDNPGARRLAANPLLLTILAVMKRQGRELPEDRVLLYEAYIKSLLTEWHLVRSLRKGGVTRTGALAPDPHVRRPELVLQDIALWMQEQAPGKGLVSEGALRRQLSQIYAGAPDGDARCDDFLAQMRGHAGLLVDRGARRFGFIHLTFMEYLAGRALAARYLVPGLGAAAVVTTLGEHLGEPDWRETSLLCLGALGKLHGSPEAAAAVIEGLLALEVGASSAPGAIGRGSAALLCGLALRDLGDGGVTPDCLTHGREVLLSSARAAPVVPAPLRMQCAEVLAALGDPRPELTTLDAMPFCRVPAGSFQMGSGDTDPDARDNERPAGTHRIGHDYWIGRHPVTVAQFRAWLGHSGRKPRDPDCLSGPATSPVVWVDWHEAAAFCDWLTGYWQEAGLLPSGWAVRLPSEPEWEKAARGGESIPVRPSIGGLADLSEADGGPPVLVQNPLPARRWPFADDFDADACHCSVHGDYRASPAGCFPSGASP